MIAEFEHLDQEEKNLMFSAPVLVAILIAGADGKIDKAEMREAVSISSMKKIKARKELKLFYDEVTRDFEDKFKVGISIRSITGITITNLPLLNKFKLMKLRKKYS